MLGLELSPACPSWPVITVTGPRAEVEILLEGVGGGTTGSAFCLSKVSVELARSGYDDGCSEDEAEDDIREWDISVDDCERLWA